MWLKERLNLEASQEKSGIIHLKDKNMKFLGITYKLVKNPRYKKIKEKLDMPTAEFIAATSVTEETYKKMKLEIRDRVKKIQRTYKHEERLKAITDYNGYIRGLKFYSITSKWYRISSNLTWDTRAVRYNRFKEDLQDKKD
jgi:hypothetical protein